MTSGKFSGIEKVYAIQLLIFPQPCGGPAQSVLQTYGRLPPEPCVSTSGVRLERQDLASIWAQPALVFAHFDLDSQRATGSLKQFCNGNRPASAELDGLTVDTSR